jgi:hypothetical protein
MRPFEHDYDPTPFLDTAAEHAAYMWELDQARLEEEGRQEDQNE